MSLVAPKNVKSQGMGDSFSLRCLAVPRVELGMTKAEQNRFVNFRYKFIQHAKQSGNVALTCRYFGISREKRSPATACRWT